MIKLNFLQETFHTKILFCNHYSRTLNTFMRKGKDPDPNLDPYLTDPEDLGGPKTYGSYRSGYDASVSGTLL
jgi:hypothetical protein